MGTHSHPHTHILTLSHPHRLLGGRKRKSPLRKISSSSGKKLIECALEEVTETRETGFEENLFDRECVSVRARILWTHVSVCVCVGV